MRRLFLAVDGIVAFLGVWGALALVCVYGGLSFQVLLGLAWMPLVAGGALLLWPDRLPPTSWSPPPAASLYGPGVAAWALAAAALGLWHLGVLPYFVAWVAGLIAISTVLWPARGDYEGAAPLRTGRLVTAVVMGSGVGLVVITGVLHAPRDDDAYYINAITSALQHPHLPVLSFDGMHGDPTLGIQQPVHRPQTYELLLAAISWLTSLPPAQLYWVLAPSFFALLAPLSHARFLHALRVQPVWLGVIVINAILLFWGDDFRTYGTFSYVRLFEGKAVFVTVLVPLIVVYALRFVDRPDLRSAVLLVCVQLASVCMTSTALLVVPLAVGLCLLASAGEGRDRIKPALLGLFTLTPVLVVILLAQLELGEQGPVRNDGSRRTLTAVLGETWRSPLCLSALIALPWLSLGTRRHRWLTLYVGLALALLLNEFTGPTLAAVTGVDLFTWRIYWALPVPALLGATLVMALRHGAWTRAAALIGTGAFLLAGTPTFGGKGVNYVWFAPKLPKAESALADQVMLHVRPDSVVLAPAAISLRLTGYPTQPRLIGVRDIYLRNMARYWGKAETKHRRALVSFAAGRALKLQSEEILGLLQARCVDLVVTSKGFRKQDDRKRLLKELGFKRVHRRQRWDLWKRPPPCEP